MRRDVTFDGERCERCAEAVEPHTGSWWSAPDELWNRVSDGFNVLCPPCFTGIAAAQGVFVYWQPVESTGARLLADLPAAEAISVLTARSQALHEIAAANAVKS